MLNRILTALLLWTVALLGTPAFAADGDQVAVTLRAFQVITAGKDVRLVPTTQAQPGDVIEYQVTYHNAGQEPARQVKATLPVPEGGMSYLEGSASPGLQASLDGVHFAEPPLKRDVVRNGRRQQVVVPPSEYRFLRWDLGDLGAGQSKTVNSRMRLGDAGKRS